MAEIVPNDILFRAGGATLVRYGVAGLKRAVRGWELGKETFTRASTGVGVDRLGVGRVFAADQLRLEWVDLDGDGVRETPGFRLEGARTQLVTDPENFGAWSIGAGTPGRTSGQNDPFGGTAAYLLEDNDAAAIENIYEVVTFTGDATKCIALFIRAGTSAGGAFGLFDATAGLYRHLIYITWTAGVPSLSTGAGAGTLYPVVPWGNGWYLVAASVDGVVAANPNNFHIGPTKFDSATHTGTMYACGANAWDAVFPSSYQGPSGGATVRAADALTFPIGWGPQDLTVYAKLARPAWADASGSLGVRRLYAIGSVTNAAAQVLAQGDDASRNWSSFIDTATIDVTVSTAIPAGATMQLVSQFRSLGSGGLVRQDVGSGFGSESSAATAFTAWQAQSIILGNTGSAGNELFGVLIDLIVAKGLRSLAEMAATP